MHNQADLNADLSERLVMDTKAMDWQASPSPSVWRKRLYHTGSAEAGVVTSVVRYEPGSSFASHEHPDGEEIFVIDGVFSDEAGDYPAGSYILNPEGFSHAPSSGPGCILFVKLRQYAGERPQIRHDINAMDWELRPNGTVESIMLDQQDGFDKRTQVVRIMPGGEVPMHGHPNGEEVFVLEGSFEDQMGSYSAGTWIRNPIGSKHSLTSKTGCMFFIKTGCFPTED
jgi:anti-sigma factor ChrR (cupin superfamily)